MQVFKPRRAIACYEAALRVYTESDFPSDWATTQNNLGNAYSGASRRVTGARTCAAPSPATRRRCGSAPRRTSRRTGQATQNNLGIAYSGPPDG